MLEIPHIRQLRAWTCGPACVRMVLRYFSIDVPEADLVAALSATPEHGTNPRTITAYLRRQGFVAHSRSARNLADIIAAIKSGRAVIVAYQDHGPRGTDYATCYDHGHYAVAVAADEKRVTLADPGSTRPRRQIKTDEFLARWRDIDAKGRIYRRWAVSVA